MTGKIPEPVRPTSVERAIIAEAKRLADLRVWKRYPVPEYLMPLVSLVEKLGKESK